MGEKIEVCGVPFDLSSAGSKVYDENFTRIHVPHVNRKTWSATHESPGTIWEGSPMDDSRLIREAESRSAGPDAAR